MTLTSRFASVSRRAFMGGATAAAVLGLAACTDDRTALAGSATTTAAAKPGGATTAAATGGAASTGAAPAGNAGAVTIAFTYKATAEAGAGGRGGPGPARNPYIAVWIEDSSGKLVKTVSLWHLQGRDNWLNELKRWYQVSGGKDTGSSATRAAGSYTVAWDLTDLSGAKVSPGTYYVCVEAAREHGPYSLVRGQVSVAAPASTPLADQGELTGVSVTVAGR